jgi:hypothetical protein
MPPIKVLSAVQEVHPSTAGVEQVKQVGSQGITHSLLSFNSVSAGHAVQSCALPPSQRAQELSHGLQVLDEVK